MLICTILVDFCALRELCSMRIEYGKYSYCIWKTQMTMYYYTYTILFDNNGVKRLSHTGKYFIKALQSRKNME